MSIAKNLRANFYAPQLNTLMNCVVTEQELEELAESNLPMSCLAYEFGS